MAGLWPFHAPRNDVSWSVHEPGVLLGKHGSMVSALPFQSHASRGDDSFTLEIWLKPNRVDSDGIILAFYWPENRVVPFALRQFRDGLVLERGARGRSDNKAEIYVGGVFNTQKPVFVTITSGNAGTATYVDGRLVKNVPSFTFSSQDLTGQFVVGNAPLKNYSWSGQLKGLAIYDRELCAAEVSENSLDWTVGRPLNSPKREDVVARYLFDQGTGNSVRNQADSETDLLIPEHFFVLHEQFLEKPSDEFQPTWSYWKNVGVNVVGFIPLGFLFYAFFSRLQNSRNATAITIIFGFAVSLSIEVLQAFLPTRDSGMTDLITNTLGTAIGVMVFRHKAIQGALVATGLRREQLVHELSVTNLSVPNYERTEP